MSKYSLDELTHEADRRLEGTRCFNRAILAEGTNAATFKTTTNTLQYCIKGMMYDKAPEDNIPFSAGHTVVPISSTCLFAVCVNSAEAVSTVQGEILTTADIVAGTVRAPDVDDDDLCVIGYIKVVTNGSTTFTPGTTDLGAAGITDTYSDASVPPLAGQLG